ncbi:hypothetical protein [Pelomonas sp. KK5]|uniref:hypothetical protein n=1 Tax=Pelomonas sp. KK5 TaxID=1855730 RepID=UPI00097C93AC|nr:hypothetical protein [Pelomonas sp. KK5]
MTNRLQEEAQRLYPPPLPDGRVRALRIELARPADWTALGAVWRGVQAELDLPAPAIAINGRDGYQLWFSLGEPVAAGEALAFGEALRWRWLGEVADSRLALTSTIDGSLPPLQCADEQWAAFVAPDLAPVFEETPWLDMAPGAEGQADLLSRLQPIKAAAWQEAVRRLGLTGGEVARPDPGSTADETDPRAFLRRVMNDPTVEMALRIEAAKVLLANSR